LSFEFAVPEFAEDAISGHITTSGTPWKQPRYDDPATDITEPAHREALAERYDAVAPGGIGDQVVAGLQEAVADDDAPDGEGVTTASLSTSGFVLLESDPEAAPTFAGAAVLQDVEPGEHRLTVNVPGAAPYSERLQVGDGDDDTGTVTDGDTATATDEETPTGTDDGSGPSTTVAGADGRLPVVANENAVKLRVDAEGTDADLERVAVEDDFGGRLYESRLDGPDTAYVHAGGAYTTEVRDADGAPGAFRVNPDPDGDAPVTVDRPDTGKRSMAEYLANLSAETRDRVADAGGIEMDDALSTDGGGRGTGGTPTGGGGGSDDGGSVTAIDGLVRALDAVREAAENAAAAAENGDAQAADRRLEAVRTRLERVSEALANAGGALPDPVAAAVDRRVEQADERARQARETGKP
jgi:hypothetical protein